MMDDVHTTKIRQIIVLLVRARDLWEWGESHGRNTGSNMQAQ